MGLIKELVLLPVAPVRFTLWVSEKVADQVDQERLSAGAGAQQLHAIEEARVQGELDDERAEELEGKVIEEQIGGLPATDEGADRG